MSFSTTLTTPQKPLPGAYFATPAPNKALAQPIQNPRFGAQRPSPPPANRQNGAPAALPPSSSDNLTPSGRAAKTIDDTLAQELRYPQIDDYLTSGISSDYDITTTQAWAPFSKSRTYQIPDKIFDQYNEAQVSTMMGLFADIKHAWVSIDNALYLWDYTHPDPPLVGYEEQSHSITAVRMVTPRPGVFVPAVTRVLVIATTAEITLVGVALEKLPAGTFSVSLYETRMSVPIRGLNVATIEGSASGRIFFTGTSDNDIYELVYQQEERWFYSRCNKVNHTSTRLAGLAPSFIFSSRVPPEITLQLVVDDTRQLIYALSSASTIRIFHMKTVSTLDLAITKPWREILNHMGHMIPQTDLITANTKIVSIHPISSHEAQKLSLVAVTDTGCRIFLSATSSYGYMPTDTSSAPLSMQVHHVKFPPSEDDSTTSQNPAVPGAMAPPTGPSTITTSRALSQTRQAYRYAPGFFLCFVSKNGANVDDLFLSAPDPGRINRPADVAPGVRFPESAVWLPLGSRSEAVGQITPPFSAARTPSGFANELAVQFDKTATEFAILTNTGVHTIRRQRLVDIFVSAIRNGRNEDGLEGTMRKFIRLYGRTETAATALAVACGQAVDSSSDLWGAAVTDPAMLEQAKTAFIEYGGKPQLNENALSESNSLGIENVKPSPRHDGLAVYIARLVRSFWRSPVILESITPTGGLQVVSSIDLDKLHTVQHDMTSLKEFLDANKNFIDGLAGPEALGRVSTRQQEIALQAEHRALHALVSLISNIIEGISFVQMLFSERMDEILLSLAPEVHAGVKELTYADLFSTAKGKDIAKELVKAIVNRNILNGANVETVADALRRRCGSFCSPADVIIFKAQEHLRRAAETGSTTELGRNLLNESLTLYKEAAPELSHEQLQNAVEQYISMHFFAGAIALCLVVAHELDRGNRALLWIENGRPENDPGKAVFESRRTCYDLIHTVITALDTATDRSVSGNDVDNTTALARRSEAYAVIDGSEDEVFQTDLYDWYLEQRQENRLLVIQSPYVVTYLERRFEDNLVIANLLWKYHGMSGNALKAAQVQVQLARSNYDLTLNERIEFLGRARANASASSFGTGRQARQSLLLEISELLDIAGIQSDILERLQNDDRLQGERKADVVKQLNSDIQSLNLLYNQYADQAAYYDICLFIYQAAQHQNRTDIADTWDALIRQTHMKCTAEDRPPWEGVANIVRTTAQRLNLASTTFPVNDILPKLKKYQYEFQRNVGPSTWVADCLMEAGVEFDTIFTVLVDMLYNNEAPFRGNNRQYIADDILYVATRWFQDSGRGTNILFGGEQNTQGVQETLASLPQNGLSRDKREDAQALRLRIDQYLR